MRPTTRRRGVTLIEMLIVVAMLGILSAFAMPKVRAAQRRAQLRAARDVVSNYLTSARRSSLTRSASTTFVISGNATTGHVISVTMRKDDGTEVAILSGYNLKVQNAATLTTEPATASLTFDKRGLMRNGMANTLKLVLTNDIANQRDSVCISGAGLVLRGSCR